MAFPFAQRLKGYVRVIAIKWGKLLQRYVIPKSEIILTVPQKHGILSETSSVATIMYCIGAWVSEVARLRILRKTKISRHIFQPGVKTRVHQNTIPIIITRISLEPSEIAVNIPALKMLLAVALLSYSIPSIPCQTGIDPHVSFSTSTVFPFELFFNGYSNIPPIYIYTLIFKGCFIMLDDMHHIIIYHLWIFMRAFGERTSVWRPLVKGPQYGGLWKCRVPSGNLT